MEIIHVVLGKANPQRMNGVNKVVYELATRQTLAGKQVQVWGITQNPVHDYPARLFSTVLFKAYKNPFRLDKKLVDALRIVNSSTIFHLHGGFVPMQYRIAMELRKANLPFVFTPHGSYNLIAMKRSSIAKKIYFGLFERKLLAASRSIHSLGKSEVDGLATVFPNNKSVLIPYGFDVLERGAKVVSTSSRFVIGYCGRLDAYTKGLPELIEAFARFVLTHPHSKLWLIGDGPDRKQLEQLVAGLLLEKSVVFHGSKFGEEKEALLSACSVFASPSRNEGLPTAVLEAASMGVACLVTEATNTGDAIRKHDAGFVTANTTAVEIADGLHHLYHRIVSNREGHLLSSNAINMIRSEFNWNTVITRFQKMYARA